MRRRRRAWRREHAQRVELAVPRERSAHRLDRGGIAEPQRREAVAELGEVEVTLRLVGGLHAADKTTAGAPAAMVMRDAPPARGPISPVDQAFGPPKLARDASPALRHAPRANEANFGAESRTKLARDASKARSTNSDDFLR